MDGGLQQTPWISQQRAPARGILRLETALCWMLRTLNPRAPEQAPPGAAAASRPYPGAKMTSSGRRGPGPVGSLQERELREPRLLLVRPMPR